MAATELTLALDQAGARYELLPHAHTESALAEARAVGVRPDEVAKTIVLTAPAGHVRAVIPAGERIDVGKLAEILGERRKQFHMTSEAELRDEYPQFELGAVPPIGGPIDTVVIDRRLAEADAIVFEAGTHDESVRLPTADLIRLADARLADICQDGDR